MPNEQNTLPTGRELRRSQRLPTCEKGMVTVGKERFEVDILDLGLQGFSFICQQPVPVGELIELEVSDAGGVLQYSCQTVFRKETAEGYVLGMVVLDQKPIVVQIFS
ncbi:MAG: PilZ domain-containing protein [Magnetococcus sp. DMHC-6]